jgi:hypothetical protein
MDILNEPGRKTEEIHIEQYDKLVRWLAQIA